jgi:hypothetical protein
VKLLSFLFVLNMTLAINTSALAGGSEVEDGAGGIDGLTIAEGNIPFLAKPEAAADVPELQFTLRQIAEAPMSDLIKDYLLETLLPGPTRSYHQIPTSADISSVVSKMLERESKLSGTPVAETKIFAVTDAASGDTVLFPDFYRSQDPLEQAAVLFREALSLSGPRTEKDPYDAAKLFQQSLKTPQDPEAVYGFYNELANFNGFSPYDFSLYAGLAFDMKNDAAFVALKGKLPMKDVFGADFMRCWIARSGDASPCFSKLTQTNAQPAALCGASLFCRALKSHFENFKPFVTPPLPAFPSAIKNKYHLQDAEAVDPFLDHLLFSPAEADMQEVRDSLHLQLFYDSQPVSQLEF